MIDHLGNPERLAWARAFRSARHRNMLTQEQVAERAGLDVRTIQRIESDGKGSSASFRALASAFGVAAGELVQNSTSTTLTLAILNEKGGVGRTAICANLAGYLARIGHRVLMVQAAKSESLYETWLHRPNDLPLLDCCVTPNADCIEAILASAKSYDIILIDGARYQPDMSQAIIRRSSAVLVPLGASIVDVWGTEHFLERVRQIRPRPPFLAVLNQIREYEDGDNGVARILEALRPLVATYGINIARTRILQRDVFSNVSGRFGTSFRDIIDRGITVHDARSDDNQRAAASELEALWNEVLTLCRCRFVELST